MLNCSSKRQEQSAANQWEKKEEKMEGGWRERMERERGREGAMRSAQTKKEMAQIKRRRGRNSLVIEEPHECGSKR